jgi:hypothetical protein
MYTKTLNLFASLLMIASFFSCKNDKQEEPAAPKKPTVKVALDAVIKKDDSLQIFYIQHGETEYNGALTVWASVKGSDKSQEVLFDLPEDVLPTKLRIDISKNKDQDPIEIKKFTIKYKEKAFQVKDTMFFQYFIPNEQVEWDRKKATATFKNDGKNFDPQFGSRDVMDAELLKVTGSK